ncbi:MAG: single-stranded DNA-binding protein [Clostridia bacterium]|nr:single-stranded DNA-binding protein [Clostridia bacterium]
MNSVILIGNLTRDPELRYSTGANQTAICKFSIAVNDGFGDNKKTSFIPITVFGKAAENCDRFLKKGSKVCVNGRIQTGSYEKDGRTVYTTDVIANNYGGVEFLSGSQGGQTGFGGQQGGGYQEAPAKPAGGEDIDVPGGFQTLQDDDIPF